MHWRHKGSHLHNNDASLVSRSAHVLCWQCALALSLSVRGPGRASPAVWLAGFAPLAACLAMTHVAVFPPTQMGALLWRHMHMVYWALLFFSLESHYNIFYKTIHNKVEIWCPKLFCKDLQLTCNIHFARLYINTERNGGRPLRHTMLHTICACCYLIFTTYYFWSTAIGQLAFFYRTLFTTQKGGSTPK